jgi:hypothetical protein
MAKGREVRSFDYVNQPYERVRDALTADALGAFRSATRAAGSRAESVASELRVNVGGFEVGAEIALSIGDIEELVGSAKSPPAIRIPVEWEAARKARLFPLMSAVLAVYPLTPTETQLDFSGTYDPPLGRIGDAVDAVVGHRIAEASVHRFVTDVAHYLRGALGKS